MVGVTGSIPVAPTIILIDERSAVSTASRLMDQISLKMKGDLAICVPRQIAYMSTYVLLEQEDWFEKEIGFVRRMLRPGMRVLDIGANHGVYTLSMAKAVGGQGAVWSYEPASATAALLRQSVERNGFRHVTVRQLALSNRQGTARLGLESNSEINALTSDAAKKSEDVPLTTLDQELDTQAFGAVDFVKLDAEGEEANIVAGGGRFFSTQSPLVMFERKHGDVVNTALPDAFRNNGYGLYRLLGPDVLLVPFRMDEPVDPFELNLFACKPDRAALLAWAGHLTESRTPATAAAGSGLALLRGQRFASAFNGAESVADPAYAGALDQYAVWRDAKRPLGERFGALSASLVTMKALAENSENSAILSSLARAAIEAGERKPAFDALDKIFNLIGRGIFKIDGPFWPPTSRYDDVAPGTPRDDWFLASAIEAFERLPAFSSYFADTQTLTLLDWLNQSPYVGAEMERRRQLMRMREGTQQGVAPAPILVPQGSDNLNSDFWRAKS